MLVHFSPNVIAAQKWCTEFDSRITTANRNRRVLEGEPRLENYFNRIIPPTVNLPDPAQVEFQYDGRDGVNVPADLTV